MTRVFTQEELERGAYYQHNRDDAYYRNFYKWAAEYLVTGRPVWRGELSPSIRSGADGFVILEGTIHAIERVRFLSGGGHVDDPQGDSIRWTAVFPDPIDPIRWQPRYFSQTSDGHEFSSTRALAIRRLTETARRDLEERVRQSIEVEKVLRRLEELK